MVYVNTLLVMAIAYLATKLFMEYKEMGPSTKPQASIKK